MHFVIRDSSYPSWIFAKFHHRRQRLAWLLWWLHIHPSPNFTILRKLGCNRRCGTFSKATNLKYHVISSYGPLQRVIDSGKEQEVVGFAKIFRYRRFYGRRYRASIAWPIYFVQVRFEMLLFHTLAKIVI